MASPDLVIAFANTHADAGGRVERFSDADGVATWWREVAPDSPLSGVMDADAAAVREIRDALVTVLLAHSSAPELEDDLISQAEGILARASARYPLVAALDRGGAQLRSAQDGVPGMIGQVIAAATELGLAGDWSRVKACSNPPCHYAFYDRSRNHSRAFCTPGCSSQVGMRAYRQRQRDLTD